MNDTSPHAAKGERIHWLGWGINGSSIEVAQYLPIEGSSDFVNTAGYRGPCPSDASKHTYEITLFALDAEFMVPRCAPIAFGHAGRACRKHAKRCARRMAQNPAAC